MKLRFLSLLVLPALISCQSVGRKPARAFVLDAQTTACDFGFARAFDLLNETDPTSTSKLQTEYLRHAYASESQARLLRAGNTCEKYQVASAVAADTKLRLNLLTPAAKSLVSGNTFSSELDGPLFTDPSMPAKMGCYGECVTAGGKDCSAKCGVSQEMASGPHQFFRFEQLMGACREYEGDGKTIFHRENFVKNLEYYLPLYREFFIKHRKDAAKYIDSLVAAESLLQTQLKQATRLAELNKNASCKETPPSIKSRMADAVFLMEMRNPVRVGTGFWIKGRNNESRIATAYHNYDHEFKPAGADVEFAMTFGGIAGGKSANAILIANGAQFDIDQDFWQSTGEFPGQALDVISSSRLPQIGQKFYAVGFPNYAAGEMKINPCELRGFTGSLRSNSPAMAMQLRCEQATDLLEGMSGGPIVDEQGTVWGVITNRTLLGGVIFATSLGRDADGEVRAGQLRLNGTNLCLDPNNWSSRQRCN